MDNTLDLSPFAGPLLGCVNEILRPFARAGWEYASDGRICVRRPTVQLDTSPAKGRRFPRVEAIFENFPHCAHAWPARPMQYVDCWVCRDWGETDAERVCWLCAGGGRVDVPVPDAPGCPELVSARHFSPHQSFIRLAGRDLAICYVAAILHVLKDVTYCPEGQPDQCLFFTAAGDVQGALMPLEPHPWSRFKS
jgi:hypothetical protein